MKPRKKKISKKDLKTAIQIKAIAEYLKVLNTHGATTT